MTTRSHQATVPLLTDDVEQDGDIVCLDEHYPTPDDDNIYLRSRKKTPRSKMLMYAVVVVLMVIIFSTIYFALPVLKQIVRPETPNEPNQPIQVEQANVDTKPCADCIFEDGEEHGVPSIMYQLTENKTIFQKCSQICLDVMQYSSENMTMVEEGDKDYNEDSDENYEEEIDEDYHEDYVDLNDTLLEDNDESYEYNHGDFNITDWFDSDTDDELSSEEYEDSSEENDEDDDFDDEYGGLGDYSDEDVDNEDDIMLGESKDFNSTAALTGTEEAINTGYHTDTEDPTGTEDHMGTNLTDTDLTGIGNLTGTEDLTGNANLTGTEDLTGTANLTGTEGIIGTENKTTEEVASTENKEDDLRNDTYQIHIKSNHQEDTPEETSEEKEATQLVHSIQEYLKEFREQKASNNTESEGSEQSQVDLQGEQSQDDLQEEHTDDVKPNTDYNINVKDDTILYNKTMTENWSSTADYESEENLDQTSTPSATYDEDQDNRYDTVTGETNYKVSQDADGTITSGSHTTTEPPDYYYGRREDYGGTKETQVIEDTWKDLSTENIDEDEEEFKDWLKNSGVNIDEERLKEFFHGEDEEEEGSGDDDN